MTTSFNVTDEAGLLAALADIGSGPDAAAGTAYTITLANNVGLSANTVVTLLAGSSVRFNGPGSLILPAGPPAVSLTTNGILTNATQFTGVFDLTGALVNLAGSHITGGVYGQGAADTVTNTGTIQNAGVDGVALVGGTVTNTAPGLITGGNMGVYIKTGGTVTNTGSIDGAVNQGVLIVGAGTIDNTGAGQITGGSYGVFIYGPGSVTNTGTISGRAGGGAVFSNGATVTNGAVGNAAALISGSGGYYNGVAVFGGTGTVTNYGTISGDASGVVLNAGGSVANEAGATLSGVDAGVYGATAGPAITVTNAGTIKATGASLAPPNPSIIGVLLGAGGEVDNGVGGVGTATISGADDGVAAEAFATVTNAGTITGTIGVDLQAGGSVTNGTALLTGALISGSSYGVRITGLGTPAGSVTNFGTILGGVDFYGAGISSIGTVTNAGSIGVIGGLTGTALRFGTGDERLILNATGSFGGTVEGSTDGGSATTLELAAGTSGTLSGLIANAGTVTDSAGTFSFSHMTALQIDAGASWTLSGANSVSTLIEAGGTLTVAGTLNLTGQLVAQGGASVLNANAITGGGTIVVGHNGTLVLHDAGGGAGGPIFSGASTPNISFTDATGRLTLTDLAGIPASTVITSFTAGDILALPNVNVASTQVVNTNTLDLFDLGHVLTGQLVFNASAFSGATLAAGIVAPACFAAGTRIQTADGLVAVEDLAVGDLLETVGGSYRPVVWLGHRHVVCRRHAWPRGVLPVRIAAHAFGPGLPRRPLLLSPEHAVFVDAMLVPVRELVNGTGITQIAVDEITYWHVELDSHDVILAEGLPAESYLDSGQRADFEGGAVIALHPGFGATVQSPCAPIVRQGPRLEAIRARLDATSCYATTRNVGIGTTN